MTTEFGRMIPEETALLDSFQALLWSRLTPWQSEKRALRRAVLLTSKMDDATFCDAIKRINHSKDWPKELLKNRSLGSKHIELADLSKTKSHSAGKIFKSFNPRSD